MGKLTVYGHPISTATRKTLMVLHEKNIPYEFKVVDITKGAHKAPDYLAHQPFGQIPVLYDDDFKLYESRAIMRYLDETAPGASLTPKDPKEHALMEQWISIEMSHHTSCEKIVFNLMFAPFFGAPKDQAVVDSSTKELKSLYTIMNKHLEGKTYIVGSSFSLADICFMPYLAYLLKCEGYANFLDEFPHLKHWWTTVTARESWKKVDV